MLSKQRQVKARRVRASGRQVYFDGGSDEVRPRQSCRVGLRYAALRCVAFALLCVVA